MYLHNIVSGAVVCHICMIMEEAGANQCTMDLFVKAPNTPNHIPVNVSVGYMDDGGPWGEKQRDGRKSLANKITYIYYKVTW